MKLVLVATLGLGLGTGYATAQAQDAPRQLGGAPTAPVYTPRPATQPAPATSEPAPRPAPATTGAAPQPGPQPAPYQLPGNNTHPARYQVGLRTGQLYNVADVTVKSPLFGRDYLLLDGQHRVDMAEVGFYETETGHYVRTTLPGSGREVTLRREKTGRISLYATYNTSYYGVPGLGYGGLGYGGFGYGGFGGYPYGGYRTTKTEYFSKDKGPIQSLNTRNLTVATADNAGAQALLAQSRRYQRGVVASYVVAGGLLVAGLSQSLRGSSQGISPLTYLAVPTLIVPLVLQSKQASAQRQAIALYNAQ